MAPPVDIDGIREPVAGSLLYKQYHIRIFRTKLKYNKGVLLPSMGVTCIL